MNLQKASRSRSKIKMALQGPSGSGKTYSSLLLARGLSESWSDIAVIDTEHGSANLYAHLGEFNVLGLNPPYSPEAYINALEMCEKAGLKVIIIDSISHEWEGEGGILDVHGSMAGNSFTNWAKLTPRHNSFVQKILHSSCHIISTIRTKQDYVLTEKNGKQVPEKVGLKGITRDGMDYEFTIVMDVDIKHQISVSKDRTGLFTTVPQFMISTDTGIKIKRWCESGKTMQQVKAELEKATDLEDLRTLYESNPEYREVLQQDFTHQKSLIQERQRESKILHNGSNS